MAEPNPRPWGFVSDILAAVGVQTLPEVLDAGTLTDVVGLEEQEQYAKIAAVNLFGGMGALVKDGDHPRGIMGAMFVRMIAAACSTDGPSRFDDVTGQMFVVHPVTGNEVEVTEDSLRHWVWMVDLLGHDDLCERTLDALPESIRDAGMEAARESWGKAEGILLG